MLRAFNNIVDKAHIPSYYEEFSYGFFAVICLAFALLVHINNYPMLYIQKTDFILDYISEVYFKINDITNKTQTLPLYTPLDTIKNINNKNITIGIYDYTIVREINEQIMINKVEDV